MDYKLFYGVTVRASGEETTQTYLSSLLTTSRGLAQTINITISQILLPPPETQSFKIFISNCPTLGYYKLTKYH